MARLANETVAEMVASYRDDSGATLAEVAEVYGVTAETVMKHVAAAGVVVRTEDESAPERSAPPSVADITSSPEFQAALAKGLSDALKGMGAPAASAAPADWAEFMASMKQLAGAMEEQRPGYNKKLSPEDLASREEGKAEFFRLIEQAADAVEEKGRRTARELGLVPHYLVGPNGYYAKTENGEELFSPGQPLYLTSAPPADFEPLNHVAGAIMAAQSQWHGEETADIADQVSSAQMRAMGRDPDEADRRVNRRNRDFIERDAETQVATVGPRRIMGTTVEETGNDGHSQFRLTKGQVARPLSGPVFVEAA